MPTTSFARTLVAAALLAGAASLSAQTQNIGRTGNIGGGAIGGSAAGSGGSGNNTRQYQNSTMVGDAMITSDADTRQLIVVTDDETNESIKKIVADLDRPKPQVLISVIFLQVTHTNDLDLGVEASYTSKLGSTSTTGTAQTQYGVANQLTNAAASTANYGGYYSILSSNITATIHALATNNKTQILSRPTVLTRSSQQATILVGQSVPLVTNTQLSAETGITTNSVTYQDVGIILKVTPFITPEGNVEMIVSPQISSLDATGIAINANTNSPVINITSADTVVVTPSDKTVVIGGLIQNQNSNEVSKVPILGDIPLIGNAFKRTVKNKEKTELLIFMTPHVVKNPADLERLMDNERNLTTLLPKEPGDESNKIIKGN